MRVYEDREQAKIENTASGIRDLYTISDSFQISRTLNRLQREPTSYHSDVMDT